MQIVQSSFANVPNAPQMLQERQSVRLEGSQPAHTAEGNGSLKTLQPAQEVKEKLGQKSSYFQPSNSLRDESIHGHRKVGISKCSLWRLLCISDTLSVMLN